MDAALRAEVAQMHARFCTGLADSTRILIVHILADGPHNVNDIADALDMPQPTVSRHLKILRERGIVEANRDGKSIFYALADDRIIQALNLLRSIVADQLESQANLARNAPELLRT